MCQLSQSKGQRKNNQVTGQKIWKQKHEKGAKIDWKRGKGQRKNNQVTGQIVS